MWRQLNIVGLTAAFCMLACTAIAWVSDSHMGKLTAVQKDSVMMLDLSSSESKVFEVNEKTKIIRKGEAAKVSNLAIGDRVRIDADRVESKFVAKIIDAMPAQ